MRARKTAVKSMTPEMYLQQRKVLYRQRADEEPTYACSFLVLEWKPQGSRRDRIFSRPKTEDRLLGIRGVSRIGESQQSGKSILSRGDYGRSPLWLHMVSNDERQLAPSFVDPRWRGSESNPFPENNRIERYSASITSTLSTLTKSKHESATPPGRGAVWLRARRRKTETSTAGWHRIQHALIDPLRTKRLVGGSGGKDELLAHGAPSARTLSLERVDVGRRHEQGRDKEAERCQRPMSRANLRQVCVGFIGRPIGLPRHERDDKRKLHMYTPYMDKRPKNETVDEGGERMLLYKDV
ncbi:hypothetical protein B0H14DRAFT_3562399 [Mycena olivaceomarginata]|nr:hypothetical protein B0H14DRAFT_3562399 [Mycena olivaceomarginata]